MRSRYKKLASFTAPLIARTGIHRLFAKQHSGIGSILMFHRILPKSDEPRVHNHDSLEISPDHLEKIIHFFQKHDYRFASIAELPELVENDLLEQKIVVFTFDDGYQDNYEYAYPIFKKYNIPFAIYVTTNFIEHKAIFWWYLFENILLKNDSLEFTHKQVQYNLNCQTASQKEEAFEILRNIVIHQINPITLEADLNNMLGQYIDSSPDHQAQPLSWDQLRQLARDPLVTIGAHTSNHFSLTMLSDEELYSEIMDGKRKLEYELGIPIKHFAYPFGKIQ